jgi:glucose-6-phosphate isomerase
MSETNNPAHTPSPELLPLQQHAAVARSWHLRALFEADTQRFQKYSLDAAGLFLDFSKNHLNDSTLSLLVQYAQTRGVEAQRDAMFRGEHINVTEDRAVLHTALRLPPDKTLTLAGHDITADIQSVLTRMEHFAGLVRSGSWKGYSGERITDIVNIGIGGSDLGPAMSCAAMRPYMQGGLRLHFVSNADGHDIDAKLAGLRPQSTLFIVASKTFTTQETMLNAQTARGWFLQHAQESDLALHFVAVSTNAGAVSAFGIDTVNMFPFWDWVGGRYSIWSAIGLPLILAIGMERFREFLAGAHAMDQHFQSAPLDHNMPVLLALTSFWYRQFFGSSSQMIAPYHQDLALFPAYLQQLEMESNGKSVTRDGQPIVTPTAPVIWGSVGTNGQHAYFQLLHQGTDVIAVDFIAALKPAHAHKLHHKVLLANCFAQSEALMRGKNAAEAEAELQAQHMPAEKIRALLPHRVFPGNRASNTILMQELTPATLGALLALYEHKTFVQGVLWNINSFDQWGVELGKVLAGRILAELDGSAAAGEHDASTQGLIARASGTE